MVQTATSVLNPIDHFIRYAVLDEGPDGQSMGSWRYETVLGYWRDEAACASADSSMWFPDTSGAAQERAQRICREDCSVVMDCLGYAIFTNQRMGIWGGEKAETRKGARRRVLRRLNRETPQ